MPSGRVSDLRRVLDTHGKGVHCLSSGAGRAFHRGSAAGGGGPPPDSG
jgi:hypothetical protein